MALAEFVRQTTYSIVECCHEGCNVLFAMTCSMYNQRKEDHKYFYCTNGHQQYFSGETEAQKLKRQLESKQADLEWQHAQRRRTERQLSAAKGQVTKIKNRVGNGVCPCCNRSFLNLHNHMRHRHPEWKDNQNG